MIVDGIIKILVIISIYVYLLITSISSESIVPIVHELFVIAVITTAYGCDYLYTFLCTFSLYQQFEKEWKERQGLATVDAVLNYPIF